MFIVVGTCGGRLYGVDHTGLPPSSIARYEQVLALGGTSVVTMVSQNMRPTRRRSLTISRKATIVVVLHTYTDKCITLQTFWNDEEGFMSETTVTDVKTGGRSGKGSVPVTVSVLNFDPSLGCDSATFQPCSDRALSTLKVLGDASKELYPISTGLPSDQVSGLFGFFFEEELFGGHVR